MRCGCHLVLPPQTLSIERLICSARFMRRAPPPHNNLIATLRACCCEDALRPSLPLGCIAKANADPTKAAVERSTGECSIGVTQLPMQVRTNRPA